jgi:hypothetical protein
MLPRTFPSILVAPESVWRLNRHPAVSRVFAEVLGAYRACRWIARAGANREVLAVEMEPSTHSDGNL